MGRHHCASSHFMPSAEKEDFEDNGLRPCHFLLLKRLYTPPRSTSRGRPEQRKKFPKQDTPITQIVYKEVIRRMRKKGNATQSLPPISKISPKRNFGFSTANSTHNNMTSPRSIIDRYGCGRSMSSSLPAHPARPCKNAKSFQRLLQLQRRHGLDRIVECVRDKPTFKMQFQPRSFARSNHASQRPDFRRPPPTP